MSDARLRLASVLAALAGFSFLLHFVWEMLQSPLYSSLRNVSHGEAVAICTRATAGDVGIALLAYGVGALSQRHWLWIWQPRARGWLAYVLTGLAITVMFEWLWAGPQGRWMYGENMLTVPILGVGLSPLLQWLLLPPLAVWLTFRHSRICR